MLFIFREYVSSILINQSKQTCHIYYCSNYSTVCLSNGQYNINVLFKMFHLVNMCIECITNNNKTPTNYICNCFSTQPGSMLAGFEHFRSMFLWFPSSKRLESPPQFQIPSSGHGRVTAAATRSGRNGDWNWRNGYWGRYLRLGPYKKIQIAAPKKKGRVETLH